MRGNPLPPRKEQITMYIEAIKWYFGMTEQQARDYYKLCTAQGQTNRLDEILKAYQQTAQQAFWND